MNPVIKDLIELPPEQRVVAVINHSFGGLHHTTNFQRHDEAARPYWTCTVYELISAQLPPGNRTELTVVPSPFGKHLVAREVGRPVHDLPGWWKPLRDEG